MIHLRKLFVVLSILTILFSVLFYGSSINFQWDYFKWIPFLKQVFFLSLINGLCMIMLLWHNKKDKKITILK